MFNGRQEQIETTGGVMNPAGATEPATNEPTTNEPVNQQSVEQKPATQTDQQPAEPEALNTRARKSRDFEKLLNDNRDYRTEFDRRLNQAVETAKLNWEQKQRADRDEAARLAGMNEAQRREYQLERERAALEADKAAFARQQLQVTVGTELQKRGLSAEFAPWLTGDDAESSQANINRFEAMWNASITAAVNTRMRADTPPRDPKKPAVDYSKMSDEEYYAAVMKRKE